MDISRGFNFANERDFTSGPYFCFVFLEFLLKTLKFAKLRNFMPAKILWRGGGDCPQYWWPCGKSRHEQKYPPGSWSQDLKTGISSFQNGLNHPYCSAGIYFKSKFWRVVMKCKNVLTYRCFFSKCTYLRLQGLF